MQKLFSCSLWFNPIVWWFNRHLVWESEKICDEGVLNYSEGNTTYAKSILKVTRYCIGRKILGYSGMSDIDLEGRLENIIKFNRKRISGDALRRFLIVIVVMFLVLTTTASGFLTHRVKPSINFLESYNQYFQGRYRWDQRGLAGKQTEEDLMAAMKHFKDAIALDPNNAQAYSGLADVYNFLPWKVPGISKDDVKAQAEEAVMKALALDPNLGEAHASFGFYKYVFLNDSKGAEREYLRAIELNPNYAPVHHFYGLLLENTDRVDEALVERRKAYELEPSLHYSGMLGHSLGIARHHDAAIIQLQRTLEQDPKQVRSWFALGAINITLKKYEDATRAFVRFAELTGENKDAMRLLVSLIEEHKRTGEPVSPPPELESIFAKNNIRHYLYASLGQKEQALEAIEQTFEKENFFPLYFSFFDFLRSEPRFIALDQKRKQFLGFEEQ